MQQLWIAAAAIAVVGPLNSLCSGGSVGMRKRGLPKHCVRGKRNMDHTAEINRGLELLALCQALQSERDGVDRPAPFAIDKFKTLDQFAKDINTASTNMAALHKLIPQMLRLAELGRKLEADGKLEVGYGDDYSSAALDFVLREHGVN